VISLKCALWIVAVAWVMSCNAMEDTMTQEALATPHSSRSHVKGSLAQNGVAKAAKLANKKLNDANAALGETTKSASTAANATKGESVQSSSNVTNAWEGYIVANLDGSFWTPKRKDFYNQAWKPFFKFSAAEDAIGENADLKQFSLDWMPDNTTAAQKFIKDKSNAHGTCRGKIMKWPKYGKGKFGSEQAWLKTTPSPCFGSIAMADASTVASSSTQKIAGHNAFVMTVKGKSWKEKACTMRFSVRIATCKDCCSCHGLVKYETSSWLEEASAAGCEIWYTRAVSSTSTLFSLLLRAPAVNKKQELCPPTTLEACPKTTKQTKTKDRRIKKAREMHRVEALGEALREDWIQGDGIWSGWKVWNDRGRQYNGKKTSYFTERTVELFNEGWKQFFTDIETGQEQGCVVTFGMHSSGVYPGPQCAKNPKLRNAAKSTKMVPIQSPVDKRKYDFFVITIYGIQYSSARRKESVRTDLGAAKQEYSNFCLKPKATDTPCQVTYGYRAAVCASCCSCKRELVKFEAKLIPDADLKRDMACKSWNSKAVSFVSHFFNIVKRQELMFIMVQKCPKEKMKACTVSYNNPSHTSMSHDNTSHTSMSHDNTSNTSMSHNNTSPRSMSYDNIEISLLAARCHTIILAKALSIDGVTHGILPSNYESMNSKCQQYMSKHADGSTMRLARLVNAFSSNAAPTSTQTMTQAKVKQMLDSQVEDEEAKKDEAHLLKAEKKAKV